MSLHVTAAKAVIAGASLVAATGAAVLVADADHSVALALIGQLPAIITAVGVIVMAAFSYALNVKMNTVSRQTDGLARALVKKSEDVAAGMAFSAGVQHAEAHAAAVEESKPSVKQVVATTVTEIADRAERKRQGDG